MLSVRRSNMPHQNLKHAATNAVKLYSGKHAKILNQLSELVEVLYNTAEIAGECDSLDIIDNLDTAHHEICLAYQAIKDKGESIH